VIAQHPAAINKIVHAFRLHHQHKFIPAIVLKRKTMLGQRSSIEGKWTESEWRRVILFDAQANSVLEAIIDHIVSASGGVSAKVEISHLMMHRIELEAPSQEITLRLLEARES